MKQVWKKIAASSTAVLTSLSCISWTGSFAGASANIEADEGVEISASNFPDVNVRDSLAELDGNDDGYLSSDELSGASLIVTPRAEDGSTTTLDLTGVQLLSSLENISIWDGDIKGNVDLSNIPSSVIEVVIDTTLIDGSIIFGDRVLNYVEIYNSYFNSIDYGTSGIRQLDITGCYNLSSIKIGPSVYCAYISDNDSLSSIDVRNASGLEELECHDNYSLSSLDLSGAPYLIQANLSNNGLSSLNVKNNSHLKSLNIQYNEFDSFDLSQCPQVTYFYFGGNNFSAIDLTKLNKVLGIGVSGMGLTSLDEYKAYFDLLDELDCSNNDLSELDLTQMPELGTLNCSNNMLSELDLSAVPNLHSLNINQNRFSKLDIPELQKLRTFKANDNLLTSVDFSKCPDLFSITCNRNPLTSIRLPQSQIKSMNIWCEYTQLKQIDASMCDLIAVHAEGTPLTDVICSGTVRVSEIHGAYIGDEDQIDISKLHTNFDYSKVSAIRYATITPEGILTVDPSSLFASYKYDGGNLIRIFRGPIPTPDVSTVDYSVTQTSGTTFKFTADTVRANEFDYGYVCFVNGDTGEVIRRYPVTKARYFRNAVCSIGDIECSTVKTYLELCSVICGTEVWDRTEPVAFSTGKISAPQNVKAEMVNGQVRLTWDAVAGATSYRVYRAESATGTKTQIKTVGTLGCTDTTAVSGKTYYYFVAAYNSGTGKLSNYSASAKITVQTPLAAPEITSVTTNGSSVVLKWNAVEGATSYRVFRADSATGTKTQIKTVGTLGCTDTTVTAGKTYYYFVAAYDSTTSRLSDYSAVKSIKVQATLAEPTVTSITTDGSSVVLKWNAVTGATSYRVYRADSATGTKTQIKTVGTLGCTDTTVTAGKTYYYFVAAYDSTTSRLSDYSAVKSIKVQSALAAPTITSISTNGTSVTLAWNAVTGATSYRVFRADSATGTKTQIKTVGTLGCTDTTVTAGKTYYYFVAAYDSTTSRLSEYSVAKSIKVQAALAAPTITSISTNGTSVTLAWNAVTGATSYRVFRADSATGTKTKIKTVGTLGCTDTTVTAGKTYYYFVAAYDSTTSRLSAYSAAKNITVQDALDVPVITSITSNGNVVLKWNVVEGATSYRIYRADSATGTKTQIKTVGTLYGTDTTTVAGNTYYYFVAAYDSKTGRLSDYSAAKSITALEAIETPVITSGSSNGISVSLTWNAVEGATSYRVFRADSATGTKTQIKIVGTLGCTDTTAVAGNTYYYFVAAYDSATGRLSAYSAAESIKV